MPKGYTIKTLAEAPDVLGDYPGQMNMLTYELDTEQVALTYRRMPQHTGGKGSYGHFHREQEEVYVVVAGSGEALLDGEVLPLRIWDVLRVSPQTVRAFAAGDEGLELVAVGSDRPQDGGGEMAEATWPDAA